MTARDAVVSNTLDDALDSIIHETITVFREVAGSEEIESILHLLKEATTPKYVTTEELVRGVTEYLTTKIREFENKIADKQQQINSLKSKLKSTKREISELIEASDNLQESANSGEWKNNLLSTENNKFKQELIEGKQQLKFITQQRNCLERKIKLLEENVIRLSANNKDQAESLENLKIIDRQKGSPQPIYLDFLGGGKFFQMNQVTRKHNISNKQTQQDRAFCKALKINRNRKRIQ